MPEPAFTSPLRDLSASVAASAERRVVGEPDGDGKAQTAPVDSVGLDVTDYLVQGAAHQRDSWAIRLPSGMYSHTATELAEAVAPLIAGSGGCPACIAEAVSWTNCKTCLGSGWVRENDGKPWGGLCCGGPSTEMCEHGACSCGAGDPCPSCNQNPPLSSGFVEIIASVEDS